VKSVTRKETQHEKPFYGSSYARASHTISIRPNVRFSESARRAGNGNSNQNLATAQKIQRDLQNAGFKDVQIVAESFVVQAKSKDGDPVVMTIGPHGMSVFEAMNNSGSGSKTTGSSGSQKMMGPSSCVSRGNLIACRGFELDRTHRCRVSITKA
jgi:hypothetical protein